MKFAKRFVLDYEKYKIRIEDCYNLFTLKNVQSFELDNRGNPLNKKMLVPNHLFFVDAKTGKKIAVEEKGLLAKNDYIADKQYYLMQIFQVEKDLQKAKNIYISWDWLEFIVYQQSLLSERILEY